MASAVQSLRLCVRAASRRPVASARIASRPRLAVRPFTSTPLQRYPAASRNDDDDDEDELEAELYEDEEQEELSPAEMQRVLNEMRQDKDYEHARQLQERVLNDLNGTFIEASRPPPFAHKLFWAEDEPDPEMMIEESREDKFEEDDIMSLAHGKFEEFREFREYARIAAWQMPLLSKLATPFEAPTVKEPLRFRYTSYMGEFHPAEKKVVVEFSPRDMPLSEAQQQKLRKLLGPRWNPETDIAKMSCEQFEHQAQNKRYLGDLVNKLLEQAKDPTDTFEDIPLDTRHHVVKVKPKFPKEWRMTEERRKFIDDTREKSLLLDQKKEEEGTLVVGAERIHLFFNPPPSATTDTARVKEPEMANARLDRSLAASLATRRQQQLGKRP